MFRREWWWNRCWVVVIAVLSVLAVLLAGAVVWECGSDQVAVGQSLDEAKAALRRAGAKDVTAYCGMFMTAGGHYEVSGSYWELPDGRTISLSSARESGEEPFRLFKFVMWKGWYKLSSGPGQELPVGDSVRLRRSVFAVVPGWLR